MKNIDHGDVLRAVDALIDAYGVEEALAKARQAEVESMVPDLARAVREELVARNTKAQLR